MVLVADDLTAWLVALLADAGRKRLTSWLLGTDQERALRQVAVAAIDCTAAKLRPEGGEPAEELAMVIGQVFSRPLQADLLTSRLTLLEALQAGVTEQMAALDDPELTGTGRSSAEVLQVPVALLAETLTSCLVHEIIARGAVGGPLTPLANQLNHDMTRLQSLNLARLVGDLTDELHAVTDRRGGCDAVAVLPLTGVPRVMPLPADRQRPFEYLRVRNADPRSLGVHAAINVTGAKDELPTYVFRKFDTELRKLVAADNSCFVLLVGGSSVGKSRSLYEAIRSAAPGRRLIHPADAEEIRRLAATSDRHIIVWLDELQRYLRDGGPLTAATVRSLLRAERRIVITATIWPEWYVRFTALPERGSVDPYEDQREILRLARVIDVSARLDSGELAEARTCAVQDPRLELALRVSDYEMTQTLAAGPDLVRRWENPQSHAEAALLTAAVDFSRLELSPLIETSALEHAALAYFSGAELAALADDWFQRGISEASSPVMGVIAPLNAVATAPGDVKGFALADFLLQHGHEVRSGNPIPDAAWQAFVEQTFDPDTLFELGQAARRRALFAYAETAYRRAMSAGNTSAISFLVGMLERQDRGEEARQVEIDAVAIDPYYATHVAERLEKAGQLDAALKTLLSAAKSGHPAVLGHLGSLLGRMGHADLAARVDELAVKAGAPLVRWAQAQELEKQGQSREAESTYRTALAEGNFAVALPLGDLLAHQGRMDEAEQLYLYGAQAGDPLALARIVELLEQQGRLADAERLCREGLPKSFMNLVRLLRRQSRIDDAVEVFRQADRAGEEYALINLARMFSDLGCDEEAEGIYRERAEAGDLLCEFELAIWLERKGRLAEALNLYRANFAHGNVTAAGFIADMLARGGDIDGAEKAYRLAIQSGDELAIDRFARFLDSRGRPAEARKVRQFGLKPDGSSVG
jgi:tetratricopeptide (TPR) repeat protein